jgi:hypothetical protein
MRERLFKEMLFCGTPEVYFMGLGKLHAQVTRALSFISGLQQPPHSTSETEARMDEYDRELAWKEVMVCVQDIVCALLGPDYYIEKKIPESECCRMEHDIEDVDLTPKSDPDSLIPAVEVTTSGMGVVELVFERGTPIELARIVHNHLTQKFTNHMLTSHEMEAMRAVAHDLLMSFVHEGRLRRGLRGWEFS